MDTTRHTGKVAIVTGAANGIGLATALRPAREGAHVIGCDVNDEALADARAGEASAGLAIELSVNVTGPMRLSRPCCR
jgi:3-oxoacyl-[acyl-carrier protein] reductase